MRISSPPCYQVHTCQNELCHHRCVAILSVETDQSHLCGESEARQVGRDGMPRRGKLATIVPIALACVGSDPLTSMHLQSSGPCADYLTSAAARCHRAHRPLRVGVLPQVTQDHRGVLVAVPPGGWHRHQRRCNDDLVGPTHHQLSLTSTHR